MDLDDAIKYEQATSTLYPPGHPDRAKSFDNLTRCRQLRLKRRGAILWPDRPPVQTGNLTIPQLIRNIVLDVLKTYPPHLLNIQSGVLCDRSTQISQFENSQEYE